MPETDLYLPVKALFESLGYEVKAEVKDFDVLCVKGEETVGVELKLRLNLDVLVQAALRQKICDKVYIAVPSPKRTELKKRQNISHVLRRLEIGLITVKPEGAKITFPPKELDRAKALARNKKNKEKLMEEFSGRHGDNNLGGSNGKITTLYRERSILIAALSEKYGEIKISDIPHMTGNPKAKGIIDNNYYGWFEKNKSNFFLTEKGKTELKEYEELKEILLKEAEGTK